MSNTEPASEELPKSPPSSPKTRNKILFLVTNVRDEQEEGIGFDIIELARAIRVFLAYHFLVDIVSIQGGKTFPDPAAVCSGDADVEWFLENDKLFQMVQDSKSITTLQPEDWDAIYFVGGYGAMWEYRNNLFIDEFARTVYDRGGVLGFVGHGAVALAYIHASSGELIVTRKTVTGFSNEEEIYAEVDNAMLLPEVVDGVKTVEDILKRCGAHYTKAIPFAAHCCSDRHIVTGQNKNSAEGVANLMISVLKTGG